MIPADTKQSILDAAEELFGAQGYSATSLRELTTRAGVNLAAVHYHFGSKEGLAEAVLARRFVPINEQRLFRLDQLEAAAPADRPLDPTAVMAAFLEPALESCRQSPDPSGLCRVFGRILIEQPPFLLRFLHERFGTVGRRFVAAFRRSVPGLSEGDALWRLHFTIGALAHTLQNAVTLRDFSRGLCDSADLDGIAERLVEFATGGMCARPGLRIPQESRP